MKPAKRTVKSGAVEPIELDGPESATLTLPPERRTGPWIIGGLALLVLAGLAGLAIARPEVFVTAVQAFAGGR